MSSRQRIVVIGAGVIGAQIAWHLAEAGAEVIVVDAAAGRATEASFGWINASFYLDTHHHALRVAGMEAYARLAGRVPLPVAACGTLSWENTGDVLMQEADRLQGLGYDATLLDAAQLRALEPALADPPDAALHFPGEMAAESGALAEALLRAAVARGARRISGLRVTGFQTAAHRVAGIETDAGPIRADHVVLSAGTGSAALMATLGLPLPMAHRPALMVATQPVPPLLRHILVTPHGELRQTPDGALIMPAAIGHQSDTSETLPEALEDAADSALGRMRALLPGAGLRIGRLHVAERPVPADDRPVLGQAAEGLSVAVLHSGITLGAIVGELMAREVLRGPDNETTHWLAPYRPGRFAGRRDASR